MESDNSGGGNKKKRSENNSLDRLENDDEDCFKQYIISFPAVESHYCRNATDFSFLDSKLKIKILYRLYKEKFKAENGKDNVMKHTGKLLSLLNKNFTSLRKIYVKCVTHLKRAHKQKKVQRSIPYTSRTKRSRKNKKERRKFIRVRK